jgi:hypothetical protein
MSLEKPRPQIMPSRNRPGSAGLTSLRVFHFAAPAKKGNGLKFSNNKGAGPLRKPAVMNTDTRCNATGMRGMALR